MKGTSQRLPPAHFKGGLIGGCAVSRSPFEREFLASCAKEVLPISKVEYHKAASMYINRCLPQLLTRILFYDLFEHERERNCSHSYRASGFLPFINVKGIYMKRVKIPLLLISFVVLISPCSAQSNVVAVIDTDAFNRNGSGISRLVRAQRDLVMLFSHCGRGTLSESDCRAASERRIGEVIKPISAHVEKHLEDFARRKGIELLIDKSSTSCVVRCRWEVLSARDVTDEFIKDYNRLNP